jgi:hypothetical protein
MRALAPLRQGYVAADAVIAGLVIATVLAAGVFFFWLRLRKARSQGHRPRTRP